MKLYRDINITLGRTKLFTQNSKLKETSKMSNEKVFNFGIPAYKTESGDLICTWAKDCIKYCYAQNGPYMWSNVKPAFLKRYKATLSENFVLFAVEQILKIKNLSFLRVHDSGDYYDRKYFNKWIQIANLLPHINFYSYTNSLPFPRQEKNIPENFDFIFSDGGKLAHTINKETERHSIVFQNREQLLSAGYVDASKNDLLATKWYNKSNKVGLIYH